MHKPVLLNRITMHLRQPRSPASAFRGRMIYVYIQYIFFGCKYDAMSCIRRIPAMRSQTAPNNKVLLSVPLNSQCAAASQRTSRYTASPNIIIEQFLDDRDRRGLSNASIHSHVSRNIHTHCTTSLASPAIKHIPFKDCHNN